MANQTFDLGRVGIWTGALDGVPSSEAQQRALELEQLGYPTLWIPETVGRDPFVTATLILSATTKLKVATGIANIYARDAVTMANTQRSLEEAFPGRFLLGLGVSHEHLVDRVRHHDYSRPYSKMVQFLEDMDKAVFRAVGRPSGRPLVVAALGPKMLKLSAEKADGAHPYFVPVEHTAQAREILGPDPILAVEQMIVLDTDRARALETARKGMAVYLRAPNYVNNLKRYGFGDEDFADGGSERLVDAIVATGDVAPRWRIRPTSTPAPATCAPSCSRRGGPAVLAAGGGAVRSWPPAWPISTSSPIPLSPVRRRVTTRENRASTSGTRAVLWRDAALLEVGADDPGPSPAPRAARSGCPGRGRGTGASPASASQKWIRAPGTCARRRPAAPLHHEARARWASSTMSWFVIDARRSRRRWRRWVSSNLSCSAVQAPIALSSSSWRSKRTATEARAGRAASRRRSRRPAPTTRRRTRR
jgi:probable F420-dependent oxidoreductase